MTVVIPMCVKHGVGRVCHVCIDYFFKMLINKQLCLNEVFLTVMRSSKINYFSGVAGNEHLRRKLDRSGGEVLSGKVPVVVHNARGAGR